MKKRVFVLGEEDASKKAKIALLELGHVIINITTGAGCTESTLTPERIVHNVTECDAICLCGDYLKFQTSAVSLKIAELLKKDIWYFRGGVLSDKEDAFFADKVKKIDQAIEEVIGVSRAEFSTKKRDQILVYCRMLFAHFMKQSGLGEDLIGGYINCSQQGVNSLRNKVENEVSHNPTFRELYEKVRNKLNQSNG
jgi:hypothetical protein